MCDAEILTIAIVAALKHDGNFVEAGKMLDEHGYIPVMLSRSRFNRRLHRIKHLLLTLFAHLGEYFKAMNEESIYVLDTFPVSSCDNYRIFRSRRYRGESYRGYQASKKRYFYGLKIHMLVTPEFEPVEFFLTPGGMGVVKGLDFFDYDPRDPVMSLCTPDVQDTASDQRPLDHRRDVLVYQTAPLPEDVEILGDVVVKLFAASSAPDTDFTAKLVDVHPDGLAVGLCYGIVRAQYRDSYEEPSLLEPGRVYPYSISLRATNNVFKVGHRIRIDISSSNFPFYDRNHNTGRAFYSDTELAVATQAVYHTAAYPSQVILPIVPSDGNKA